jgi:hypothetical protein
MYIVGNPRVVRMDSILRHNSRDRKTLPDLCNLNFQDDIFGETIKNIRDSLEYIEQETQHRVASKASLGLSGTKDHDNTGSTLSLHSSRQ